MATSEPLSLRLAKVEIWYGETIRRGFERARAPAAELTSEIGRSAEAVRNQHFRCENPLSVQSDFLISAVSFPIPLTRSKPGT